MDYDVAPPLGGPGDDQIIKYAHDSNDTFFSSAQSMIQAEIQRRNANEYMYITLTPGFHSGLNTLLNYREKPKNRVFMQLDSREIERADRLSAMLIPKKSSYRSILNVTEKPRKSIWDLHTAKFDMNISLDCVDVDVVYESGCIGHIWTIFLPNRQRSGDVRYSLFMFLPENKEKVENFLRDIDVFISSMDTSNKVIHVYGGEDIALDGKYSWDSLVLSDHVLESVKDDLAWWMASEDLYKRKNIPYRRGYLFEGPPGNGKTAVIRTILSTNPFSAFSFDFSDPRSKNSNLVDAFRNAVTNAPAVFILEDIDRVFQDTLPRSCITKDGFLNCLDGVAVNHGLVVIATANHPETLDPVIRMRPGRFDIPVKFSNPDEEQRTTYLTKMLGTNEEHAVSADTLDWASFSCAGMSMAFMKTIYETACSTAFKRKVNIIEDADLRHSVQRVKSYYSSMEGSGDRSAGFKRPSTEQKASQYAETVTRDERQCKPGRSGGPPTFTHENEGTGYEDPPR